MGLLRSCFQFGDARRVVNSAGCVRGECSPRREGRAHAPVPFGSSVPASYAGSTSRQLYDLPVRTPMHLCSRRRQGRLPAAPLSGPLHGLRTSRYREACASAPHQGRSELPRHRKHVLKLASLSALSFGTNPPDLVQGWFLVNESHLHSIINPLQPTS
jgi:hypothetical protein